MVKKNVLKKKLEDQVCLLQKFLVQDSLSDEDVVKVKKAIANTDCCVSILNVVYEFDLSLFDILENKQFTRIPTKILLTRNNTF